MNPDTIEKIIKAAAPGIDRNLEIPKKEYWERWKKVQKAMKQNGYNLAYACGSELDRSDVAWLAGVFDPIIERYGILVPAEGTPVVVAGSEGGHVIEDCVKVSGAKMALLMEYQISDEDYRFAKFETLENVVRRMVSYTAESPIKVAILSSSQFIPHDHVSLFQGRFGSENVIFDVDLLRRIKYEKSRAELKIIGTANTIADVAFLGMLSVLKPEGVTAVPISGSISPVS